MTNPISLLLGWVLDLMIGDPQRLPHPVVWFGRMIALCEHRLNRGSCRRLKGALTAVALIVLVFIATWLLREGLSRVEHHLPAVLDAVLVF